MEVLIVGAGEMGRWFGETIEKSVTFTDIDPDTARAAAEAVTANVTTLEGNDSYDVVCLAVPMSHVEAAIRDHASRAEKAILDVSGVMGSPLESMETHVPELERVSLHPLFAPERAPGRIAVVRDRSGPVTDEIVGTLESAGNDVLETTASEHDEAMETIQAAAHTAVLSFALATDPVPDGLTTPVYDELEELVGMVVDGNPRVYADIQDQFDGADAIATAATTLAEADHDELEELYREAHSRWETTQTTRTATEAGDDDQ